MSNNRQIKPFQQVIQNIWSFSQKSIKCLCPKAPSNLEQTKKIDICYRCEQQYHVDCFWAPEKGQLFQCPFCYLKYCMPHKQVKDILFGGYLPILKKEKVEYKINFTFQQKLKVDKSIYIQARCVKFNSKNKYQISWPDSASFSIGKSKISDFKPMPTNCPLKRRADEPIKIDKTRLQQQNQIIIQQRNTCQNGYKLNKKVHHLIAIFAYTQLSTQSVLSKLSLSTLQIPDSKQLIMDHLNHRTSDILISSISVSLKCQYYGSRIKLPARSRHCNCHVQPFDLSNFINSSIHAKLSTLKWQCPICRKRAYDVVIDKYILKIMNDNPDKGDSIRFNQNAQPQIQGVDHNNNKQDIQDKEDLDQDKYQRRAMEDFSKKFDNVIIDLDDQPDINSQTAAIGETSIQNNRTQETGKQNSLNLQSDSQHNGQQSNKPTTSQKPKKPQLTTTTLKPVLTFPLLSNPPSLSAPINNKQSSLFLSQQRKNNSYSNKIMQPIQQSNSGVKKIRKLNDGTQQFTTSSTTNNNNNKFINNINTNTANNNTNANSKRRQNQKKMNVSFTGVANNVVELLSSDDQEQHKKNNNNQNSNSRGFITEKQKLNLAGNFKKNISNIDFKQNGDKSKQKYFDKFKNTSMFNKNTFSSSKLSSSNQPQNPSIISLDSDNQDVQQIPNMPHAAPQSQHKQKQHKDIQNEMTQKIIKLQKSLSKQVGKVQITEEDTQAFDGIYQKLMNLGDNL